MDGHLNNLSSGDTRLQLATLVELLRTLSHSGELPYVAVSAVGEYALSQEADADPAVRHLAFRVLMTRPHSDAEAWETLSDAAHQELAFGPQNHPDIMLAAMRVIVAAPSDLVLRFFSVQEVDKKIANCLCHERPLVQQAAAHCLTAAAKRSWFALSRSGSWCRTATESSQEQQRFQQDVRDHVLDTFKKVCDLAEAPDDRTSAACFAALHTVFMESGVGDGGDASLENCEEGVAVGAGGVRRRDDDAASRVVPLLAPWGPAHLEPCAYDSLPGRVARMLIPRLTALRLRCEAIRVQSPEQAKALGVVSCTLQALLSSSGNPHLLDGDVVLRDHAPQLLNARKDARQLAAEWIRGQLLPRTCSPTSSIAFSAAESCLRLTQHPSLATLRPQVAVTVLDTLLKLCHQESGGAAGAGEGEGQGGDFSAQQYHAHLVPNLLQVARWVPRQLHSTALPRLFHALETAVADDTPMRVASIAATSLLTLCDPVRGGQLAKVQHLEALLKAPWVLAKLADDGGRFREEFVAALAVNAVALCPAAPGILGHVAFENWSQFGREHPHPTSGDRRRDVGSSSNGARAAGGPIDSGAEASPSAEGATWVRNTRVGAEWFALALTLCQHLSACLLWRGGESGGLAADCFLHLLQTLCDLLLPVDMRQAGRMNDRSGAGEMAWGRDFRWARCALRSVLDDIVEWKLNEGIPVVAIRLRTLFLLSQHWGSVDPPLPHAQRTPFGTERPHSLVGSLSAGLDPDQEHSAHTLVQALAAELLQKEAYDGYRVSLRARIHGPLGGGAVDRAPHPDASWRNGAAAVAVSGLQFLAMRIPATAAAAVQVLESVGSSGACAPLNELARVAVHRLQVVLDDGAEGANSHAAGSVEDILSGGVADEERRARLCERLLQQSQLLCGVNSARADGALTANGQQAYRHEVGGTLWLHARAQVASTSEWRSAISGDGGGGFSRRDTPGRRSVDSELWRRSPQEQSVIVTGASDPVCVSVRHRLQPGSRLVAVTVTAYNATNTRLEGLRLSLLLRGALAHRHGNTAFDVPGALVPRGSVDWEVTLSVTSFDDLSATVQVSFVNIDAELPEVGLDDTAEDFDGDFAETDDDDDKVGDEGGEGEEKAAGQDPGGGEEGFDGDDGGGFGGDAAEVQSPPRDEIIFNTNEYVVNAPDLLLSPRAADRSSARFQLTWGALCFSRMAIAEGGVDDGNDDVALRLASCFRLVATADDCSTQRRRNGDIGDVACRMRPEHVPLTCAPTPHNFQVALLARTWSGDIVALVATGARLRRRRRRRRRGGGGADGTDEEEEGAIWRARLEWRCSHRGVLDVLTKNAADAVNHCTCGVFSAVVGSNGRDVDVDAALLKQRRQADFFSSTSTREEEGGGGVSVLERWGALQKKRAAFHERSSAIGDAEPSLL